MIQIGPVVSEIWAVKSKVGGEFIQAGAFIWQNTVCVLVYIWMYTPSGAPMVKEDFISFFQYLRYCHKMVPLRSVFQVLPHEPSFIFVVLILAKLAI